MIKNKNSKQNKTSFASFLTKCVSTIKNLTCFKNVDNPFLHRFVFDKPF